MDVIEPFVYDFVRDHGGSISAEHGLGQMKPDKIFHTKSHTSVDVMKQIKQVFDPNSIMNPYKHVSYHVWRWEMTFECSPREKASGSLLIFWIQQANGIVTRMH